MPVGAAPETAAPAPKKKRFEARPAGATRDFQPKDFKAPTGELAEFVRKSGPVEKGGVGKAAPGLGKAGGGSKKGREKRGLFGLRRGSVDG